LLQLSEASSDLCVVSADGAIAVYTMNCQLGQFGLFKGKKASACYEDILKRSLVCIQANVCHPGIHMLF